MRCRISSCPECPSAGAGTGTGVPEGELSLPAAAAGASRGWIRNSCTPSWPWMSPVRSSSSREEPGLFPRGLKPRQVPLSAWRSLPVPFPRAEVRQGLSRAVVQQRLLCPCRKGVQSEGHSTAQQNPQQMPVPLPGRDSPSLPAAPGFGHRLPRAAHRARRGEGELGARLKQCPFLPRGGGGDCCNPSAQ